MRRIAITSLVAALVAAVPGASQAAPNAAPSPAAPLHVQDRAFMTYGIEQDLAQVAFGEMALEKGTDPDVKAFAARTVEFHRGSLERLRAAAQRLDVKPPASLSPVAQRADATLRGLSGTAFDQAFLSSAVIANLNGMYSARREMAHGFDRELRKEGTRQASQLLANRHAAERIQRRLGGNGATGSVSTEDRNFLLYAMHIDMAQRGFAEIAAARATNADVRALAQDLVKYHAGSYDRLAQLATAKGMEPLREVSAITSGTRERLRTMDQGPVLDWTYLNAQAFTSYGAHYRYEREAIAGGDAQVKAAAAEGARDSRRQHWRALRLMKDWRWTPSAT